jgi:hypothetical protein
MDLIMTFRRESFFPCDIDKVVRGRGGWLWSLAQKYRPNKDDKSLGDLVSYIGMDEKDRIEIMINLYLFEDMKDDPLFISRTVDMRRLRSAYVGGLLAYVMLRGYRVFDNDLDAAGFLDGVIEEKRQLLESIKS